MIRKLLIILFATLISCNVSINTMTGEYVKEGKDFSYYLRLNDSDSTFVFTKKYFEVTSACKGIWIQRGNTVILKCRNDSDVISLMSSGYMTQRDYKIVVRNRKQLQMDNTILTKK